MGENRNTYCILGGKPERHSHLKKLSVDGKTVLKSILNRSAEKVGVQDWADSAQGSDPCGRGTTR
jgi:hypothetical protein